MRAHTDSWRRRSTAGLLGRAWRPCCGLRLRCRRNDACRQLWACPQRRHWPTCDPRLSAGRLLQLLSALFGRWCAGRSAERSRPKWLRYRCSSGAARRWPCAAPSPRACARWRSGCSPGWRLALESTPRRDVWRVRWAGGWSPRGVRRGAGGESMRSEPAIATGRLGAAGRARACVRAFGLVILTQRNIRALPSESCDLCALCTLASTGGAGSRLRRLGQRRAADTLPSLTFYAVHTHMQRQAFCARPCCASLEPHVERVAKAARRERVGEHGGRRAPAVANAAGAAHSPAALSHGAGEWIAGVVGGAERQSARFRCSTRRRRDTYARSGDVGRCSDGCPSRNRLAWRAALCATKA
jgi:hypothetical protein